MLDLVRDNNNYEPGSRPHVHPKQIIEKTTRAPDVAAMVEVNFS